MSLTSLQAKAISAITINAIEGTAPYLILSDGTKLTNLNNLLSLQLPKDGGTNDKVLIDSSMANSVITLPDGIKFKDVETLVVADGQPHDITVATVADDDGDVNDENRGSVVGKIKATWFDGDEQVNDLDRFMTSCGGPYKLNITIPEPVIANTQFGNPRINNYGTNTGITYTFTSNSMRICYVKPLDTTVFTGIEGTDIKFGVGYNAAKWIPNKGFKVSAGFPSTGFYKAQFSLIGPGSDQSLYRCQLSSGEDKVSLSGTASKTIGQNCKVTYQALTKSAFVANGLPVIDMLYNDGNGVWNKIDSYQIPIPTHWAIVKQDGPYFDTTATTSPYPALDACRQEIDGNSTPVTTNIQATNTGATYQSWRQRYMFRMNEFTNNPYAKSGTYNEGSISDSMGGKGYFSRDTDGTFTGDWGSLTAYKGSGFEQKWFYWTAEVWSGNQMSIISGQTGYIGSNTMWYTNDTVVCRGD